MGGLSPWAASPPCAHLAPAWTRHTGHLATMPRLRFRACRRASRAAATFTTSLRARTQSPTARARRWLLRWAASPLCPRAGSLRRFSCRRTPAPSCAALIASLRAETWSPHPRTTDSRAWQPHDRAPRPAAPPRPPHWPLCPRTGSCAGGCLTIVTGLASRTRLLVAVPANGLLRWAASLPCPRTDSPRPSTGRCAREPAPALGPHDRDRTRFPGRLLVAMPGPAPVLGPSPSRPNPLPRPPDPGPAPRARAAPSCTGPLPAPVLLPLCHEPAPRAGDCTAVPGLASCAGSLAAVARADSRAHPVPRGRNLVPRGIALARWLELAPVPIALAP